MMNDSGCCAAYSSLGQFFFVMQLSVVYSRKSHLTDGGHEMTCGRSLERHLKHFGLMDDGGKAISFSEWATLAQDRAGWLKLVT